MSRSPALGELLDLLRLEGLAVGVDDHLRVERLLALETAWGEDQLRIAIRAIFAKSAQELAAFDAVWMRLFAGFAVNRPPGSSEGPPAVIQAFGWRRLIARSVLVGLVLGLGTGVTAFAITRWQGSAGTNSPYRGLASGSSNPEEPHDAPLDEEEAGHDGESPADTAGGGPSARAKFIAAASNHVNLGLLVVGGGFLVAGFAINRVRTRSRKKFIPGPWKYTLRVPDATHPILDRDGITEYAAHLSWRVDQETSGDIDAERSALATAMTGGMPVLVYRPRLGAPRCLVLEDIEGGSKHWRFLYDELLRGLVREGVDMARYTFTGDPSSCTSIDGRQCCELRELVEHCDAMIVIGDGDAAFDPIERTPAAWLQTLHRVPRRLWLNPIPEARWSQGARAIARDTPMEHAVLKGLRALQRVGVHGHVAPSGFPWVIERDPATSIGFAALQDRVGPAGMRAIAAVAMTGTLSIPILRWMVEHFRLSLDEAIWLRVVTLPWFRLGVWPEGLQARLVKWLQAIDIKFADDVAKATIALLCEDEPPPGSAAHLRWELDLAVARMRAGDRGEVSHVIRKLRTTALHKEITRRFPGVRLMHTSWLHHVFAALGVALCVAGGSRLLIKADLKSSPPVTGSVHIESVPPNAEVVFNGTRLGDRTPLTVYGIPAGSRHEILVEMPRYNPYVETVDIPKTGGEISVYAVMQLILGKLVVDSQPGGAEIWIDRQLRGRTPMTLSDIDTSATKQIELRLKGYQPFVSELTWPENGQLKLAPKLLRSRGGAE